MVILGIDPGSQITGFGILDLVGNRYHYLASGAIRAKKPQPLRQIFLELSALMEQYQPATVAIESIFVCLNVNSALKLGQARGAALAAVCRDQVELMEYSARQVKKAVVGYGNAEKTQVQHMVKILLSLKQELQADEADALAIAICHANFSASLKVGRTA